MERLRPTTDNNLYRLQNDMSAWNIDGSASHTLVRSSWIRFWEETTGRQRGQCSYAGCCRAAEHGGHVWIAKKRVIIAPLCSKCNYCENASRMQGAQSRLRQGTIVVKVECTEEMRNAVRRIAVEDDRKRCKACGSDISDRPDSHTLCLDCYRGGRGRDSLTPGQIRRRCEDCRRDISDRPEGHVLCLDCYRGRRGRGDRKNTGRLCDTCGVKDISEQPESHTRCLRCFREGGSGVFYRGTFR